MIDGTELMNNFFRGWRRKLGCLLLLLALQIVGLWIRSYWVRDSIEVGRVWAGSCDGYISWHCNPITGMWIPGAYIRYHSYIEDPDNPSIFLHFGTPTPYWLIFLPLMFFSALLIVRVPQKSMEAGSGVTILLH